MINEQQIEQQIVDEGLTAPRVTPPAIDELIAAVQYYVFPGTSFTICALTLVNGFIVTGESACASPENYNKEIGEKIAFTNARAKIWSLEGYRLRCALYEEQQAHKLTDQECYLAGDYDHDSVRSAILEVRHEMYKDFTGDHRLSVGLTMCDGSLLSGESTIPWTQMVGRNRDLMRDTLLKSAITNAIDNFLEAQFHKRQEAK